MCELSMTLSMHLNNVLSSCISIRPRKEIMDKKNYSNPMGNASLYVPCTGSIFTLYS